MWVQEVRVGGRLAYKKVLGTKNPADVLTKHVPGELLERHMESLGVEARRGRAESAPELNSVESLVIRLPADWEAGVAGDTVVDDPGEAVAKTRRVSWCSRVQFRAIPATGRGRPISRESRTTHRRGRSAAWAASRETSQVPGGAPARAARGDVPGGADRRSWADLTEEQYGP